jgi:hypothetical protein
MRADLVVGPVRVHMVDVVFGVGLVLLARRVGFMWNDTNA